MSAGEKTMTQLRALVCDDEAPLRDLMARRVEKLGLQVDKASDGKEGLALIGANRYDLIVTDIYMPEVTGLELLEAAKAQDREIQVVIVTATATVENAIEAINLGAFCYLTKPFDHLSVFDNAVLRAQELRQLTLHKRNGAGQPGNGSSPDPAKAAPPSNGEVKELEELRKLMSVLPIGLVVVGDGGQVSLSTPLAKTWLEQEVRTGRRAIHRFLEHVPDQEGEVEEEVKLGQKVIHLSTAPAPGGDARTKVVLLEEKRNGSAAPKTPPTDLVEASANLREGLLQLARLDLGEEALGIIRAMAPPRRVRIISPSSLSN
jgi:CheY-like chemotaxis protein